MPVSFIHSFQSEWLKKKRSAASWLVIIGGFFIPVIKLIIQLSNPARLTARYSDPMFWERFFTNCWESMAFFFLPMGVIMATSLVTQLEFRNNTWKQLHTTPQRFSAIFFAKLAVILIMMAQYFLLFNIGIYLAAVIPAVVYGKVPYPPEPFPFVTFLKANFIFYVDCLPVIALQYLVSLRYKNFLVPIGMGLALVIACMFAIRWEYGYIIPYTYSSYSYLHLLDGRNKLPVPVPVHLLALGYFFLITITNYILYIRSKEKG